VADPTATVFVESLHARLAVRVSSEMLKKKPRDQKRVAGLEFEAVLHSKSV